MAWLNSLTTIRGILEKQYKRQKEGERIAEEAKLSVETIEFSAATRDNWHNILECAHGTNQVHDLVRIVQKEMEQYESIVNELKEALRVYQLETSGINIGISAPDLIQALGDGLPKGDPRPALVSEKLIQISQIQNNLIEWKEYHNYLDELHSAIRQFRHYVERMDEKNLGEYRDLARAFSAVEGAVRAIDMWGPLVRHITVDSLYRNVLSFHDELKEFVEECKDMSSPGRFSGLGARRAQKAVLERLCIATDKYETEVSIQMTHADKRLFTEARDLSDRFRTG